MNKIDVAKCLMIKEQALVQVTITDMDTERLSCIEEQTLPKKCYNNALFAALALELNTIVYGVAVTAGGQLPVEHAWVKDVDGDYYDTTFQPLRKTNPLLQEVNYYAIKEFTLDEYLTFSKAVTGNSDSFVGLEMRELRKSDKYKHLFTG